LVEPREFTSEGGGAAGAFWTQYTNEAGDTYLQAGSVTGGNGGSYVFPDKKLIDADSGPGGTPEPVETAGTVLHVKVSCEATIADGIMLPGCKVIDCWERLGCWSNPAKRYLHRGGTNWIYLSGDRSLDRNRVPSVRPTRKPFGWRLHW